MVVFHVSTFILQLQSLPASGGFPLRRAQRQRKEAAQWIRRRGFVFFIKPPCQSRAFSVRMEQRKGGRSAWRPLCTLTLSYPPEKAEGSISCRAHPRRGEALTRFRAYFFIFCPCPGALHFLRTCYFVTLREKSQT